MSTRLVLHDACAVLTLAGSEAPRAGPAMSELSIVERASVAVDDAGRISWVGPAGELNVTGDPEVIDCRGQVIMPALVDAHTHAVWAGERLDELEMRLRGADYEEIFAAGGGILSSVRQTRAASEDTLYAQSRKRIERMRRCGTTTFEIKSGYGLDLETELRQLRVARRLRDDGFRIKTTCLAAHAIPEDFRTADGGREAFVQHVIDVVLPAVRQSQLADYVDVFCDRGAFTAQESQRILEAAAEAGFPLRVHANEFGHTGGARVAAAVGARTADHLLHLNDEERAALRDAGVIGVLLPGTSLVLGKGYADGRALVEAGVALAVATDCNPGSCALENLAAVLALACYGNRLSPAEAITATTHNAAASLDLAHEVGRLEAGLSADLLVLDTNDYRNLVYHAASPLVSRVMQGGAFVFGAP